MQGRIAAFADDFFITNQYGDCLIKVRGKALRANETLDFEDLWGHQLFAIQEWMARVKDFITIQGTRGQTLAIVQKLLISPLREHWVVKIGDGPILDVQGDVFNHEYCIEAGFKKIAEVSKRWFHASDVYGVEIEPGLDHGLILAITAAIDLLVHQD
jgi:uncharacterized protein YxjI